MATGDPSGIHRAPGRKALTGTPLERLLENHDDPHAVPRATLALGDQVVITTRNSIYNLHALGEGRFLVSGGWFDQHAGQPTEERVNGCTYGGSAIRHDLVASPGLFLEFGNGVKTTRIRRVQVIRARHEGRTH